MKKKPWTFYDVIDKNLNTLEKNIKKLRKEVQEHRDMCLKW